MEAQIAALTAEVRAMRLRSEDQTELGTERHETNVKRLDELLEEIKEVKADVKYANGRLGDAHVKLARHEERLDAIARRNTAVKQAMSTNGDSGGDGSLDSRHLTMADARLYLVAVGIIIASVYALMTGVLGFHK